MLSPKGEANIPGKILTMSNRSVLNQTLNTMKNQFFLLQIDGLDHRIDHGEHPFLIPVSHYIYIVAPRGDNLFNDPIGSARLHRRPQALQSRSGNTRLPAEALRCSRLANTSVPVRSFAESMSSIPSNLIMKGTLAPRID